MHEAAHAAAGLVLLVVALWATLPCAYLLLLTLLSAALPAAARSSRTLFFDVIVPAHNEAGGIGRTIANLRRLDWPRDRFRILVVADNCTDATGEIARAAGAEVLTRHDAEFRGKGYALAYAFERSRSAGRAAAVVVVDADSEASPNLLEAFAARLEGGERAVQAHYGVLNTGASWRTRLMAIALGAFHTVRSRGRERLKVSSGIRGNGWCVTHALLDQVPYRAFSLTEDIEFGIELGLRGHRVAYAEEAHVDGEMVTGEQAARSQRQRWEGGRFALVRAKAPALIRAAAQQPSRICADLTADLLVLPLSYLAVSVAAYGVLAALGWWLLELHLPSWVAAADAAVLVVYVLRGWQLSPVGVRGILDLARAPGFVAWKMLLMLSGKRSERWIRTEREKP